MVCNATRRYLSHLSPAVAFLALLASAACSDTPVTSAAPADAAFKKAPKDGSPSGGSAGAPSNLVANAVKYHDGGAPHATGRSGSATLEGRAVVDGHGVTRLVITTGSLDSSAPAPGEIAKAQIKVFSADGSLLLVENHNHLTGGGVQTFLLEGLPLGSRIQVQANVRGIDGNRTDVVTLTAAVVHAAQLHVDLQLPGQATVGRPVVINGVVSEIGGDVGTRANCVLYVDGHEVDRADDIWVDAGGVVTCAFTHTFTGAGSHTVEVRVNGGAASAQLGVIGGDDSGNLNVDPGGQVAWTASVEDRSLTTTSTIDYTWWKPDGSHKEYSNTEITTNRSQTFNLAGTLNRPVTFPLAAMDLSVESAGVEWTSEHWTALAATVDPASGNVCATLQMADRGTLLFVCNGLGGGSFGYTRFAGNVTYHSYGYANTFDGITGTPENYSWNDNPFTYSSGGDQVRALGSAVQMRLSFRDAGGTFSFAPLVALTPFSAVVSVVPRSCTLTTPSNLEGGEYNYCTGTRDDESGWRGTASSAGALQ
jgi:hypothetical protein